MAVNWTPEQKQVIDSRNRNLLVSAAAGSGKTAVLVAHIMSLLTDPEHPVDIDRLLIVTFTRAAAAEMRTRIYEAIRVRVDADPSDANLLRQLSLVHRAEICTIDSFCTNVVRNYFHLIDLDPAFRIADDGERSLLMSDVFAELIEEEYQAARPEFIDFTENFAAGKSDEKIDHAVLKLFSFSQSAAYPEEWLDRAAAVYDAADEEALEETEWIRWYLLTLRKKLSEYAEMSDEIVRLAEQPDGPHYCLSVYQDDAAKIRSCLNFETYREAADGLANMQFAVKPRSKKTDSFDPELDQQAYALRKQVTKGVKELSKDLDRSVPEILKELSDARPTVAELIRLTKAFGVRFAQAKRDKGIVDFGDLSHLALQILIADGSRTEAAKLLAGQYEEIMIDEYQDSNEVQELLLNAVSRIGDGTPNVFMVGDMKQSIYRFRMARPELFVEKYDTYTKEESSHQKIELHANFRSRESVIDCTNYFFSRIMQAQVGSIAYTEDAALHYGADYLPFTEENGGISAEPGRAGGPAEFLIADLSETKDLQDDVPAAEWEARMIAAKIRKITDPTQGQYIFDKELGKYRPARFSDIVILLRSFSGWDAAFAQVFEEAGIPVYTESKAGFYETWEVRLLRNLLEVIDNPIRDIPLVAVLHSPLFDFTSAELAAIRLDYSMKEGGNGFYGALKAYQGELSGRIEAFLQKLEHYRKLAAETELSSLIRFIYDDTGLIPFVSAMPGGLRRKANLLVLLNKAEQFEATSYHGIFHFIRYIDKMRQYDVDEGEAGTAGENDNTVRIMTIHKSKGLEFPIVFAAGLARNFNKMDERDAVLLHHDLGIGADAADHHTRIRTKTLIKKTLREKIDLDSLGEELRVLYVAMTRAKEKLYLTCSVKDAETVQALMEAREGSGTDGTLSYTELTGAKNYLDWLLPAYRKAAPVELQMVDPVTLLVKETGVSFAESLKKQAFMKWLTEAEGDPEEQKKLNEILNFPYRYDDLYSIFATLSVSALKAAHLEESGMVPEAYEPQESLVRDDVPAAITGAERGTLYHLVMEKADPFRDIPEQLAEMENAGLISALEKATIDTDTIAAFFSCSLGKRFASAYAAGKGYREKQFIIGVPVREVYPDKVTKDPDELIMIQGIIDLFFEEADGLVLVDYKTDRVRTEQELIERYSIQLDLYQQALTQATGKTVKEKWIYSFALGKEIRL